MTQLLLPLAAIDAGQVFGLIILVISILSWFVNVLKQNSANAKGNKPAPQNSEMEQFLKRVLDANQGNARQAGDPNRPVQQKPPLPESRKKQKNKQQKRPQLRSNEPPKSQVGDRWSQRPGQLADQRLKTSIPSSQPDGMKARLATNHLQQLAEFHLGSRVSTAVEQDLGMGLASVATTVQQRAQHPVAQLLQSPAQVQQAMILQEILQKPRALRRQ